jgi:uroporphyrinogen-III decarboxylase
VIQPDHVPLIEDYNIPRGVEHAVTGAQDVAPVSYLYQGPDEAAREWFAERMARVKAFADSNDAPVQAWSAFGMDGIVWLTGVEGAIMMAMDQPEAFGALAQVVAKADLERTRLAASTPGVDMVVERGWYSSTDFWSPRLFDRFVYPHVKELAEVAHEHGVKFGYTMTTGVEILGPRLVDAGVDVLYFVDPIQDGLSLAKARELLGDQITLVGGINALSLTPGNWDRIEDQVNQAIDILGPTNRFVLHPVDAIFPDTPWEGIERLIEAWKKHW